MKYVFFGTPKFAAIILEKLIEAGLLPVALVCNPDEALGRKKIITPPATKQLLLDKKIAVPVFQPKKLSEIKNELENINADVFIVAAYNKIISEEIINIPKFKTVGVHPSLLPKYRGPSPIQTAILNGDKETGADLFLIDKDIDHGPILAEAKCEILEKDNYETMTMKLAELGAKLLIEKLPEYINNNPPVGGLQEQNHANATFTKKFSTDDGKVDLPPHLLFENRYTPKKNRIINSILILKNKLFRCGGVDKDAPELIFNKIRALNPDPGVFTFIKTRTGEKRVKLLEAELKDGELELLRVQPDGKKPMSFKDFKNGNL